MAMIGQPREVQYSSAYDTQNTQHGRTATILSTIPKSEIRNPKSEIRNPRGRRVAYSKTLICHKPVDYGRPIYRPSKIDRPERSMLLPNSFRGTTLGVSWSGTHPRPRSLVCSMQHAADSSPVCAMDGVCHGKLVPARATLWELNLASSSSLPYISAKAM